MKIPRDKILDFLPGLSQRALELMQKRNILRRHTPTDPQMALKDKQIWRKKDNNTMDE